MVIDNAVGTDKVSVCATWCRARKLARDTA